MMDLLRQILDIYMSEVYLFGLFVVDASDVEDLRSAVDNVQHAARDVDAAGVDEVNDETNDGEAEIIEDDDRMVSWSRP